MGYNSGTTLFFFLKNLDKSTLCVVIKRSLKKKPEMFFFPRGSDYQRYLKIQHGATAGTQGLLKKWTLMSWWVWEFDFNEFMKWKAREKPVTQVKLICVSLMCIVVMRSFYFACFGLHVGVFKASCIGTCVAGWGDRAHDLLIHYWLHNMAK